MKHLLRRAALALAIALLVPAVVEAGSFNTQTFLSNNDAAGYIDEPRGFDLSGNKNIYLTDTINNKIEIIGSDGSINHVAGTGEYGLYNGPTHSAQFANPEDIAVFGNGEQIFVADTGNNVIRKIENGQVTTFVGGLKSPKGVEIVGDTLFISDTGNNRILGVYRGGGTPTSFAQNIDQPTKLVYWPDARSIIFVNYGSDEVKAVNVNTGKVSNALIGDLEDVGGIWLEDRNLFVAASYSIGVYNQLWKVRLNEPNPNGAVKASSIKKLHEYRESEHMNWPSDVLVREDTVTWEEYYSWEPSPEYNLASTKTTAKKTGPTCLKILKQGAETWKKNWYVPVHKKKLWQTEKFILKYHYQGDKPFFRVKFQYSNKHVNIKKRNKQSQRYQSPNKNGAKISSTAVTSTTDAPTNLRTKNVKAKQVTLAWDGVNNDTTYETQVWRGSKRLKTRTEIKKSKVTIKDELRSNKGYKFRVRSCANGVCGDWSDFQQFRTAPSKALEIKPILPKQGVRIQQLDSGNYLVTLRYRPREKEKNLRAKIQLCSNTLDHADSVTANRVYMLYKGGSAILVWRANGKNGQHSAGDHRFQDQYGDNNTALLGRPKDLVFNNDNTELYIAQNNKLAVYNLSTQRLRELSGHVMDAYTEGTGSETRFSDITSIALSPDGEWLYVIDRNNHRIRKVNTKTGASKYITGAGGTNFSFESEESNGYQEGGPCNNEFDTGVAGCAYFNRPTGLTVSPDGNTLYIAEGSNNRVRAVNVQTGQTRLIAGNGEAGFVNGSGTNAKFNGPHTIDVTADGKTLYVADKNNHAIRKIDLNNNNVTTVVGTGALGYRDGSFSSAVLAIPEYIEEDNGVIYWTEAGTHTIRAAVLSSQTVLTVSGNGSVGFINGAGSNAEWHNPKGIGIHAGKLYVADTVNDVIRTIDL